MSLTSITERTLTQEILKIDEKAEYLTKLKDQAIANLLLQKQSVLEGKNVGQSCDSLENQIKEIKSEHSILMKEYEPRLAKVHECKTSIDRLECDVEEIERELQSIQQRHEAAMKLLDEKKLFLQQRLSSIQNLYSTIEKLESMIIKKSHMHASELELLEAQRQELLERTDLSPDEVGEMLEELDQEMGDVQRQNALSIEEMQHKVSTLKSDMSSNVEILKEKQREISEELSRLEELKLSATPSQLIEINRQAASLQKEYQDYNDFIDLMEMNSSEKLLKILEDRGLKITSSGKIQTGSGRIITLDEAIELGLLEGIGSEYLLKLEQIIESEIYGEISESTTSSETSSTTLSGISPSDVHYLKQVLGKPLTLALAEITAKQPRDPIHYLAHWLIKFRYNQDIDVVKKQEMFELDVERKRIAALTLRQNAERDAESALLDLIGRVEVVVEENRLKKELKRIEEENRLEEEENEENLEMEARDTLGVYSGPKTGQKI